MKHLHILPLLLVLALTACNDRGQQNSQSNTGGTSPAPSDKAQGTSGQSSGDQSKGSDGWITTSVQSKFFEDSSIKGSPIDVSTSAGVVTLEGHVPNEQARKQAVQVAKAVNGVNRVDDRLQVGMGETPAATSGTNQPSSAAEQAEHHDDGSITTRIQAKYFTAPEISHRKIAVTTTNGTVTLNGSVQSEDERQRALSLAKSVPGVTSVNDRLLVNPQGETAATSGQAAPSGQTGAPDTGQAASGTSGRLPVVVPPPGGSQPPGSATATPQNTAESAGAGRPIDDNMLKTKIQSLFFENDQTRNSRIAVAVDHGVVTLSGTVGDAAGRQQAIQLAKSTAGVVRVVDQLTVER